MNDDLWWLLSACLVALLLPERGLSNGPIYGCMLERGWAYQAHSAHPSASALQRQSTSTNQQGCALSLRRALGLQSLPVAFGVDTAKWICVSTIDATQLGVAG